MPQPVVSKLLYELGGTFMSFSSIFMLCIFIIIPIVMIPLGIARKRRNNGGFLFMIGWVFLSCIFSYFLQKGVAAIICAILQFFGISASFHDTAALTLLLTFVFVFIGYKLYKPMLYWESRKFISIALNIIIDGQSASLPECKEIVIEEFKKRILRITPPTSPSNAEIFTETQIYNTALSMLASGEYNYLYGSLTEEGKQLVNICEYCLGRLENHGAIQKCEKEQHLFDLHNFDYREPLIDYIKK